MRTRLPTLSAGSILLALVLASSAVANKIQISKTDQAAAQNALLKLADLPPPFTWKGGKVSTSPASSPLSCRGYHPKTSDLVTTGKATVTFTAQGVQLQNEAELLKTAKMVRDDFRRTFVPALVPCLSQSFTHGVRGVKVIRAGQITFPKDATLTAAYRILFTVTSKGKTQEGALDVIALGSGRTELSLSFTAILGAKQDVQSGLAGMAVVEQNLAAKIARRALGGGKVA